MLSRKVDFFSHCGVAVGHAGAGFPHDLYRNATVHCDFIEKQETYTTTAVVHWFFWDAGKLKVGETREIPTEQAQTVSFGNH